MTSISSSSSFSSPTSPRTQMNDRISAAVSEGSISATDQTALGSALDSIDSSLDASQSSGTQKSGGSFKDKIGSLIDTQVSSGTLTDAQATELKGFFAQGGSQDPGTDGASSGDPQADGGSGGARGSHGAHGHHGPPPAPTTDDSSADSTTGTASSTSKTSTTSADSATKQLDALTQMLENLRSGVTSQDSYGPNSNSSVATGLVYNNIA